MRLREGAAPFGGGVRVARGGGGGEIEVEIRIELLQFLEVLRAL